MAGDIKTLHCANCLEDVRCFYQSATLVGCGHLFCPGCVQKCTRDRFLCPIDELFVASHSPHEYAFLHALQAWQRARDEGRYDASLSLSLSQHLNFTLFPCSGGLNHPDFATCPYDHSRSRVFDSSRRSFFCPRCKVFTCPEACPRCKMPCIVRTRRLVGRSDFQPTLSSPFPQNVWTGRNSEGTILRWSGPY